MKLLLNGRKYLSALGTDNFYSVDLKSVKTYPLKHGLVEVTVGHYRTLQSAAGVELPGC